MLALKLFLVLAVARPTICGVVASNDDFVTNDQHKLHQGPIDTHEAVPSNNSTQECNREITILRTHIQELEKPQEKPEEGLDPLQDCADILRLDPHPETGLHYINVHQVGGVTQRFLVYCDMDTDGGGWMVMQRRHSADMNFDRDFATYKEGFGVMTGDFWLGNEKLHWITSRWNYELRIDLTNFEGETRTAKYGVFKTDCGSYKVDVDFYSGDAGDALSDNNGMLFSTHDQALDLHTDLNCANHHNSGWWHNACTRANLNGRYNTVPIMDEGGIFWYDWERHTSLKSTVMMIRPTPPQVCPYVPQSCAEILHLNPGAASGAYHISPVDAFGITRSIRVFCDMDTDGGGWTVFQRRQDGSVDFFLNYQSYMDGFGDATGEFWLGNENLHLLTIGSGCDQDLRFDLMDDNNDTRYAEYAEFTVGPYSDGYRIHFTTYSGTAGDSMGSVHRDMMFSTYDREQDIHETRNCAEDFKGGWWYASCWMANINGLHYNQPPILTNRGIGWWYWTGSGDRLHLRFTEMKIRPSGTCN